MNTGYCKTRYIILAFFFVGTPFFTRAQTSIDVEGKVTIEGLNEASNVENLVIKSGSGALAIMETSLPSLQNLPLASGFIQYGFSYQQATHYRSDGRVYLDGLVRKQSGTIMQFDTIFILPADFRPRSRIVVHAKQDDQRVRLNIEPSGVAWVVDPPSLSKDWISLDNIDYYRHDFKNQAVSDASGNLYNSVTIGGQEWFAENLNTAHYCDGTEIPFVPEDSLWSELSTGGWSLLFYNSSAEINDYKVYNAHTIATDKICPTGWRVPSVDDWLELSDYLGGSSLAILQLKEIGTSPWHQNATNTRGFSAIKNPQRSQQGGFVISSAAAWWTSTSSTSEETFGFLLGSFIFLQEPMDVNKGLPVRCMRDIQE